MLEGAEGTGKSTQAAILADRLGAVLTREPGGTGLGERIRALLLDPTVPPPSGRTETLLMLAARAQHVAEVIEPALTSGRDVVCDRFSGSTLAYQGYGRGLNIDELARLSRWASGGVAPELVVLLQLPADVAAGRRTGREGRDRIEAEGSAFHRQVEAGFVALAAADPQIWKAVDGEGTVEEVAGRVYEAVSSGRPESRP